MLEHFQAPDRDRYQLITEHKRGQIIAEDTGLGYERTDDIVIIQIFQQGRSLRHKRAEYRALAEEVNRRTGLSPSDLIVSMVENTRDHWSFGGVTHSSSRVACERSIPNRSAVCPLPFCVGGEELDDRMGEETVATAGDHVAGS